MKLQLIYCFISLAVFCFCIFYLRVLMPKFTKKEELGGFRTDLSFILLSILIVVFGIIFVINFNSILESLNLAIRN